MRPTSSARSAALSATAAMLFAAACTNSGSDTSAEAVEEPEPNSVFDSSQVHEIDVVFDEVAYDALIDAYVADSDQKWIQASVSIDGVT